VGRPQVDAGVDRGRTDADLAADRLGEVVRIALPRALDVAVAAQPCVELLVAGRQMRRDRCPGVRDDLVAPGRRIDDADDAGLDAVDRRRGQGVDRALGAAAAGECGERDTQRQRSDDPRGRAQADCPAAPGLAPADPPPGDRDRRGDRSDRGCDLEAEPDRVARADLPRSGSGT
jgi:hypothetical protein